MTKQGNFNTFIQRAQARYNNKFDYSNANYTNSKTKLTITCPIHGNFEQSPEKHIANKYGCPSCAVEAIKAQNTKSTNYFVTEAKKLHGDKFDYSQVHYISYMDKVTLKCNNCGCTFEQTPNSHMNGNGCSNCSTSGFREDKPAILYFLSINCGEAYKVGITNRSINERFNLTDLQSIEVLKTVAYTNGKLCRLAEQAILKKYKAYQWTGAPLLASGNTELFSVNILELEDTNE